MTEFRVTYSYGRGSFVMDLDEIMPASASNMKRIRSVIDMDANPATKALELHEYIVSRVEELKKERDGHGDVAGKAERTAKIKTFIANNDSLVKAYGVEPIADEEVVKAKKHTVYALKWDSERGEYLAVYDGKIFSKYGRTFTAYKDERGYWHIIVPVYGLAVGSSFEKNFNKAVAGITRLDNDRLTGFFADAFTKKSVEKFRAMMMECGYGDELAGAEFQYEFPVENEIHAEEPTVAENTVESPAPMEDTAPVEDIASADNVSEKSVESPARMAKIHTYKPWRDGRKSRRCRMVPRKTVRRIRRAFRSEQYWNTS